MNRFLRSIAPLAFAFLLAVPALAADQFINVLTGGTSGVYYPLGVALANDIGKAMPAVKTVNVTELVLAPNELEITRS